MLPRTSSRGQATVGITVLCREKNGMLASSQSKWEQSHRYTVSNFHSCRESLCYISNIIGLLWLFIPVSVTALILIASEVNSAEKHLCPERTTVYFQFYVTLYVHHKKKKATPTLINQSFLTVFLVHVSKHYKALQQKLSQNLSPNETVVEPRN